MRHAHVTLPLNMTSPSALEKNYAENADNYNQFSKTSLGQLEQQLFGICINYKDFNGLDVLDLGTGTGLRARDALNAGARHVDAVDISPEMINIGMEHERSTNRKKITWHVADVSKPLDHLGLKQYDWVIANGIFDHATDAKGFERMWYNCAKYLKPDGRLIANRNHPRASTAVKDKYGVRFDNFQCFADGFSFDYHITSQPPMTFKSFAIGAYYAKNFEIPKKYFYHFRQVPFSETKTVKECPHYWNDYVKDPILYIYTARKRDGVVELEDVRDGTDQRAAQRQDDEQDAPELWVSDHLD
ncbi:Demethylmenaquinone methyltransferase [Pseudocercospora fuligena]|uniref:Demethylmenaquinone methyltransferase n=1 Tax=Pseudocercospora fuligena TaxID=685502 RepID=A0A8H6RJG7_9PEZI|nr:Demethylmenaquinone methyltransferase [Pseudocercospora fuligena]